MPTILDDAPAPGTPEWQRSITASKIPAILGVSPFDSPYAVWQKLAGRWEPEPQDRPIFRIGHLAEHVMCEYWQEQKAKEGERWRLNPGGEMVYQNPDLDFPHFVTLDRRAWKGGRRFRILECKTTGWEGLRKWRRPDEPDSIPLHYLVQVQFQMGVSGIHEADVLVWLRGGDQVEIHHVTFDPELFTLIVTKCQNFYQSVLDDTPPDLDDSTATYDAVRGIHPDVDEDADVQVPDALAHELWDAAAAERAVKKRLTGAKTAILAEMGNAKTALLGDQKVATRTPSRGAITLRISKPAQGKGRW
ncbi:YqaJ viral recombinase family protein [Corynebacterium sp. P6129]|uniref:lambda-exonuclease family protein n=1 Tax=Corynebacterium antarcticum TaxID=2800405 RepID=UPI002260D6E0|nr:YqaJ viral recombinase family protein [Corynebacterium antarcticum]MCX7491499.1 YqaJ viral recombinase family protein [Corynebacterium antarcticum]